MIVSCTSRFKIQYVVLGKYLQVKMEIYGYYFKRKFVFGK